KSGRWNYLVEEIDSTFVGYDELKTDTKILAYQQEDDQASIILETTPFYAESGGQVPDSGTISRNGSSMEVLDVQKSDMGFVHTVDHLADDLNGLWYAEINRNRRQEIMKHHTATHLMHAALRRVLGDHVVQNGSLV